MGMGLRDAARCGCGLIGEYTESGIGAIYSAGTPTTALRGGRIQGVNDAAIEHRVEYAWCRDHNHSESWCHETGSSDTGWCRW